MRQAFLVTRPKERLDVARRMYGMRFPDDDTIGLTMQQLRGREGARVRKLYREHSTRTGVEWRRREYKPGDAATGDDINRVLSAANSALYGICHAVISGVGASPGLGFVHTGSAISFVLDVADLYKADYTIPLAFELTVRGLVTERDARTALRDKITEGRLLPQIIRDIKALLLVDEQDVIDRDINQLWDEKEGAVEGGVNWATWDESVFDEERYLSVIGPDFDDTRDPL